MSFYPSSCCWEAPGPKCFLCLPSFFFLFWIAQTACRSSFPPVKGSLLCLNRIVCDISFLPDRIFFLQLLLLPCTKAALGKLFLRKLLCEALILQTKLILKKQAFLPLTGKQNTADQQYNTNVMK